MKNEKLLKLNIFIVILLLVTSNSVFSDEISLTEQYGPAAFDHSSEKNTVDSNANIISDYDFNQINGTGTFTSGDVEAIKQIVVANPTSTVTTQTANNNVASQVLYPTPLPTQQPAGPLSGDTAYNVGINIANNINLSNFTKKETSGAKLQNISAPTYALINVTTKHIYATKDENTKYNPAGLTNLMTAYIATQYLKMDSVLKVNKTAVRNIDKDAAIAALNAGDTITLKDAIASMFVKGCVDSANVVAENVSNNINDFVNLMNVTAESLGLKNTKFVDPSGIGKNESTALDMSIIMAKVCENTELLELLSLSEYVLPKVSKRDKLLLYSRNTQLNKTASTYNADVVASRLGYTSESKWCVSSLMNQNNNKVIAVVLKASGTQFGDTKKLLEFGKKAVSEDNPSVDTSTNAVGSSSNNAPR